MSFAIDSMRFYSSAGRMSTLCLFESPVFPVQCLAGPCSVNLAPAKTCCFTLCGVNRFEDELHLKKKKKNTMDSTLVAQLSISVFCPTDTDK